jgi:hypothetical protein
MRPVGSGAVAAVALALTIASPAAASGSRNVQVNPTHPSTLRDQVHVLAGSTSWLVYRLNETYADGGSIRQRSTITARSKGGKTVDIKRHDHDWSLVGATLTGMRHSGNADYYHLGTGHHAHIALPKASSDGAAAYIGAGPGGVFFAHHGELKFRKPSGKTTDYGTLSDGPEEADGEASSGPDGIVIIDGTAVRYFPYAEPGTSQTLDVNVAGARDVECLSVDAHYAACTEIAPSFGREVELVPLDGSAATTSTKDQARLPRMAVDGSRLYWVVFPPCCLPGQGPGHLDVLTPGAAGSATDLTSNRPIITAYHGVVTPNPASDALRLVTSPSNSTLLLRGPHSPVTVAAYALSPGRIVDVDDQRDPDSTAKRSLRSRSRHVTATKVDVGKPTVVAHPDGDAIVVSSGTTIAYTSENDASGGVLHVRSPLGTGRSPVSPSTRRSHCPATASSSSKAPAPRASGRSSICGRGSRSRSRPTTRPIRERALRCGAMRLPTRRTARCISATSPVAPSRPSRRSAPPRRRCRNTATGSRWKKATKTPG